MGSSKSPLPSKDEPNNRMKAPSEVEECNFILQRKVPLELQDPESFTNALEIERFTVEKSL